MKARRFAPALVGLALFGCAGVTFQPLTDFRRDLCDPAAVPLRSSVDPAIRQAFDRIAAAAKTDLHHYPDIAIVAVRGHTRIGTAGVCHAPGAPATVRTERNFTGTIPRSWMNP